MSQLALPLQLADYAVFASFHDPGNEALLATLTELAEAGNGPGAWLWGTTSTGKTHLLQAVCEKAGDNSVYVPLLSLAPAGPGILDGLESRGIVCLDDLHSVVGNRDWETALFTLNNRLFDAGGRLLVATNGAPRDCVFVLADLQSRLSQLPIFQVQPLDESARAAALQLRARHRGLELPDDTASYLLKRSRRDMASLYALLDRLDQEALKAKRRLTIPFVRDVLGRETGRKL